MDKGAKDKLAGSPGENGGGQDAQKDLHSRTGRDETKRKTRKRWREEVERDLQVVGVRRWRELVIDRGKQRGIVRQAKVHSGMQRQRKKKKTNILLQICTSTSQTEFEVIVCLWLYLQDDDLVEIETCRKVRRVKIIRVITITCAVCWTTYCIIQSTSTICDSQG